MKKKRLTYEEMEPIAREATRSALRAYKWSQLPWEDLALGIYHPTEDVCVYALYFCTETPADAVIITSTVIDRYTGEVLKVEVFLEKLEEDESSLSEVNPSSQLGS